MLDRHAHIGTRRRWIKLWTQQTLFGTTCTELEPAERWVWIGFLCLAGDSPCPGTICLAPELAYSDQQLATLLHIDLRLLGSALHRMKQHGKIEVNSGGVIHICNWSHYQADYERMNKMRRNKSDASKERNKGDATTRPEEEED